MSKDQSPEAEFIEWILGLGSNSAEIIRGIYSTPWTGVPFTLSVLAIAEVKFPGVTHKFLGYMAQFLAMVGSTAGTALANFGKGTGQTVTDHLKAQGANPSGQPPPPPPLPPNLKHVWIAHATGYISGLVGSGNAYFTNQADRDKWVSDTNGSYLVHLTGNRVDETWDQDLDAKGNTIGPKLNDTKIPAPKPWWIVPI